MRRRHKTSASNKMPIPPRWTKEEWGYERGIVWEKLYQMEVDVAKLEDLVKTFLTEIAVLKDNNVTIKKVLVGATIATIGTLVLEVLKAASVIR